MGFLRNYLQRRRPVSSRPRRHALTVGMLEPRCLMSAGYLQTNLASDLPGLAAFTDPILKNPWGISLSPTGPFWLSENGAGVSDLLDGGGRVQSLVVTTPGLQGSIGSPTGMVFNGGPGFEVWEGDRWAPALFLFAGEDGTISGWAPSVDFTHALVVVGNDANPTAPTADYKGLALASFGGHSYLYATNFLTGKVDVFDDQFHSVRMSGGFRDPLIPAGFAPFGIQAIGDELFVTYARQDATHREDVAGAGNGFVDVFTDDGHLERRLARGAFLNSPWGVALAPANFGTFSGDLLVGNVGDGHINAFDPVTGAYRGKLTDAGGNAIQIDGLWGLAFGNNHGGGNADTLYFAAGIDQEQHGLFGMIQPTNRSDAGQILAPRPGQGAESYNPNSPDDLYPLPPANGPKLQHDVGEQQTAVAILLPSVESSTLLAPTLLTLGSNQDAQTIPSHPPIQKASVDGTNPAPSHLNWSSHDTPADSQDATEGDSALVALLDVPAGSSDDMNGSAAVDQRSGPSVDHDFRPLATAQAKSARSVTSPLDQARMSPNVGSNPSPTVSESVPARAMGASVFGLGEAMADHPRTNGWRRAVVSVLAGLGAFGTVRRWGQRRNQQSILSARSTPAANRTVTMA